MTKYKEFLRAKGIKLECDFESLPCGYIEGVTTKVMNGCVVAVVYSNCAGAEYAVYNRSGDCSYFNKSDFEDYMEDSCLDPEFTSWMCGTSCKISSTLFTVAVGMYVNDEKVRIAFKHMRAGIMEENVFYKWLVKQYPKHIRSV